MRVVLDCRSVFPGMGGIGRATACLARELPRALKDDELVLVLGARRPDEPLARAPNTREVHVDAAMIDPVFDQVVLPALLDELEADVYHGTCFSVPIATRVPRVATIHDVVFRRRPELVEEGLRKTLDRWTAVACDVADAIVTVSEFSRREIAELFGRAAELIDLVPNGVEKRFFLRERGRVLGQPPFVLSVGSLEPKKNVAALLRGFAALLSSDPTLPHHLVLVGGQGGAPLDLEVTLASVSEIRGRVHVLGHVPEDELLRLYGAAEAFAYLSEYEGFGLPPLEAMAAGVPTLVSDRASLPEVTGDGALHVDPQDPPSVARGLGLILRNAPLGAELARRGQAVARRYAWSSSARKLADVYRRVFERSRIAALTGGTK